MKTTATLVTLLLAGSATSALAAPACNVEALTALHVPGVTITQAAAVAAAGTASAYCDVSGTVATHGEGAPDGQAKFALQLPEVLSMIAPRLAGWSDREQPMLRLLAETLEHAVRGVRRGGGIGAA